MTKIQRLVAALMLLTLTFTVACNKPDDPNNGSNNGNNGSNNGNNGGGNNNSGIYNGHAFVDLDLPSGTLWATCNVGANSPEDYGDYFAWGETEPKAMYNWETYKYCNYQYGYNNGLTKYCINSYEGYNGFTDNLTSLEAEDDAATVNWGEGWCMPTLDQWIELFGNTHTTWTIKNEVYGRLFTASNNNSLFLPAAGYIDWSWLREVGDSGHYWSNSLYIADVDSDYAWFFHFSKSDVTRKKWLRYYGWSIRPVRTARQN